VACDDNARLIHAYIDGELDLVRSLELEEHVKSCPNCAQELWNQKTLRKAFRSANLYERAPEGLEAKIRAGIAKEAGAAPIPMRAPRGRELQWLAVAAAVVFVVFTTFRLLPGLIAELGPRGIVAEEIVSSHIRSLQPGHLLDVQSTDQHTVKPWFNGKVDFSPPVKDLADAGFPLIGGRLDYLDHRDVAALVYERRKHLINLYVWPEESEKSEAPRSVTSQGYHLVFWRANGMYFCAVSDLNADELHQFTELLQK
jgi:anti-sigma factor RsiW